MAELLQQDVVNTIASTIRDTYYDENNQLLGVAYDRGKLQVVALCQPGSADSIAEQILQNYSAPEPLCYQRMSLKSLIQRKVAAQCDADEYVLYGAEPRSLVNELLSTKSRGAIRVTSQYSSDKDQHLEGHSVGYQITSSDQLNSKVKTVCKGIVGIVGKGGKKGYEVRFARN